MSTPSRELLKQLEDDLSKERAILAAERAAGNRIAEVNCLRRMAVLERKRGALHEALRRHRQALAVCKELGRKDFVSSCYVNLGAVYHEMGKHRLAERMFDRAVDIKAGLDDWSGLARCFQNLGLLYEEFLGRPQDALRVYRWSQTARGRASFSWASRLA